MWKSRLEILYFLGLLYLVLQFQDFVRSNFPPLGISMDSNSTRSNGNILISNIMCEHSGDSSPTNHSACNNKVMTSSMNGSSSKFICLLSSRTLYGTVTVTELFSSVLLRTSEVFITCLLRFLVCGTIWKMSLHMLYTFCFCCELSATLNTPHKSLFLPKPELSNWLKTRKGSLCRKTTAFICLLSTLVMLLLTTLRRRIKLSRKKKLTFCLDSSTGPVVSSLATLTKPLGTLLILSTLFESGNSSLDPSNMMAISTSLNETTLTTSRTTDSFTQGFKLMLSTSPTTAAANATIWLSSSLRTSQPLSSTQDQALQVSSTSTQSSPFVPSATFQSVLKSTVLAARITNVSSSSLSSSGSFTSPSSSSRMHYSSSFNSTLLSLLSTLAPPLSTALPSLSQSSTILPSFSSALLSPTMSPQVPLSSLLVSPSLTLSPSPSLSLSLLPSSPPLSSPLSSSSSLSAPSPLPLSSQSQRLPSSSSSPPPSSPSLSLSPLPSSSTLPSLSPLSSPTAFPSALLSQSVSPLPSSSPPSTLSPLPSVSPLSSPSAPSSATLPLPPSTRPSPSPPPPPTSSSPLLASSPSPSLLPLITSSSLPSPSLSLSPLPSVSTRSKPPAPLSSSPPSTLPPSPSPSPASSPSPSLSPLTTSSSLPSPSLSPYSSPLPQQSPSSPSALPSISSSPSPSLSSPVLAISIAVKSSTFSNNVSLKEHTSTVPSLHSVMTSNLTSRAVFQTIASATLRVISSASSSVTHVPTRTTPSNSTRTINVTVSLINEDFNRDLLNESSAQFVNLSRRVNSTLWELFSGNVEGLRDIIILRFRNGSVKVDFQLLVNSKSNVTTQAVNQTLLRNNGTNNQGFIFGNILVQEKCSSGYCFNSGSCQDGVDGPVCSCSTGFAGSRCSQKAVVVNGNYTEWSDFTECSTTCEGGRRRRSRTCTNPSPQHGGKDCTDLGRDVEYVDCNGDVRCPVSAEIWIAVGVACGVFLLILIFVVVLLLRRRRKQAEQRNGLSSSKDSQTNGHSTIIPLEVIYEDKTVPKSTPKGQTNPEFIGDDDDDNDIYKAQLLLFLKQAHLIRPNIYPDEQDNQSDTSENSRSTSRKPSAVSRTSDKIEEDKDEQAHDVEKDHVSNNSNIAGQTPASGDEKILPTTVL